MENEIKINVPEGYEIDKENSTFECIKFKPVVKRWRDNNTYTIHGYYIETQAYIIDYNGKNVSENYNIFATKKQAKHALAMARISQIMANDTRFGGVITDEEWSKPNIKYIIDRNGDYIVRLLCCNFYTFLAFHTPKQRDLFLEENEDLVKDYLMID